MELKFLTPTEVWEGFEPHKDALENSIASISTDENNIVCSKHFFTAQTTAQGRVRVYFELYYDSRWADDRAAIILLPSVDDTNFSSLVSKLVKDGYVVCKPDYCGSFDDEHYCTTFPADLTFASYPNCLEHLTSIQNDARHTPWFVWSKIVRRTICALEEQRIVSKDRIGIFGIGVGAQIAWICAGMDSRVKTLVAINGSGYLWASGEPRFVYGNIPTNDEESAFSSGVGAETYARFVNCPVLLVATKNSYVNDVDRAGDIISRAKSPSKQLIISNGSDSRIPARTFQAILSWLNRHFAHNGDPIDEPNIAFENKDGKMYVSVNSAHKAAEKRVYVCYGEPYPFARYWQPLENLQKIGLHQYTAELPVFDTDELVLAYASFVFADGNVISTPIISTTAQKLGIEEANTPQTAHSHVIYDGSMGIGSFTAEGHSALFDENILHVKAGPFGIKGISTSEGSLSLRHNALATQSLSRSTIFHFDAYSKESVNLLVTMYTYPDKKMFTARTHLDGGEFWQKVLLECTDFKSAEGKTLSSFQETKLFTIPNADDIVFNNFLWI